jgi:hypothetical protein
MTGPSTLFRPFTHLVKITIRDRQYEVPENNPLLRCLQYLAPDEISYGRFCWNEDCQYCRITFDLGEGTSERAGARLQTDGTGRHAGESGDYGNQILP